MQYRWLKGARLALNAGIPNAVDRFRMNSNLQGILWSLGATALASIAAAMVKIAATDFHVLQILFFRQMVILVTVLPLALRSFPEGLKTTRPGLQAIRLAGAFVALTAGFWAVSQLPLTTATVLNFTKTFFVTLLAAKFLAEPFGKHRMLAIIAGFIGVIIVVRPGIEGFAEPAALVAIIGAAGVGVAMTSVRKLSQTESTETLLIYQAVVIGTLAGLPLYWLWVTPSLVQAALMLGIGILATVSQWMGIKALRLGEASLISSIGYFQLIYATLLGFLLFSELPDALTLLGAAIIIASALYTIRREARLKTT
jgi:drug/metabolite transporter (DMT)-like permease